MSKKKNEVFNVSLTYQQITPESAEHGDFSDQGFIYEDKKMSLKDVLSELEHEGAVFTEEWSYQGDTVDCYHPDFVDIDLSTGTKEQRCLHVEGSIKNLERLTDAVEKKAA